MMLFDIIRNVEYKLIRGENVEVTSIVIDSRAVRKKSLFFCIRGIKTDGHDFLADVAKEGASSAVIDKALSDEELMKLPLDFTVIMVQNSRTAMSYIAASFYGNPAESFGLIGITGTKGKTSSAFFCEAVLQEAGRKTGLIGTLGTHVLDKKLDVAFATATTPDPIELQKIFGIMRDQSVTDVVMEVSSHALALNKLDGTRFKVGVFTNITQDHLDFHKDMRSYLEAKAKLFKMCEIGVINADSDACGYLVENCNCKIITFSIENESDLHAQNVQLMPNGVSFEVNINGKTEKFEAGIGGRFTVYNLLGILGASLALGIPMEVVKAAFIKIKGVRGRLQNVPNELDFRCIIDYAHSPDSLRNIIIAVREFTLNRVITVFGCGGDKDRPKRPIMGQIAGELSDYCIITSDNPRTEEPDAIIDEVEAGMKQTACVYERQADRKLAIERAVYMAVPGDSVIIAGKGHEDYQIFADRTIHFDDYEVAEAILRKLETGGR